jgi:hypothetical protein
MYKMMFSRQNVNNAVLSSTKAMPAKDLTSDGTADFALGRHTYSETVPSVANTLDQTRTKKWYGNGSRDASQIAVNRRVSEIGVGSLNAAKNDMSFVSNVEKNTRIDALARVRGGGSVVPPKFRHRPGQSGVPIATAARVPLIRTVHQLPMVHSSHKKPKPPTLG